MVMILDLKITDKALEGNFQYGPLTFTLIAVLLGQSYLGLSQSLGKMSCYCTSDWALEMD